MKKLIYLIVLALILGLVLTGCSLLSNVGQVPTTEQSGMSYLTKNGAGPKTIDLIAGQSINVGTVTVSNDGVNLTVTYNTTGSWKMTETHLAVVTDFVAFPTNKAGNPKVGHFPYGEENIFTDTWEEIIELSAIPAGAEQELFIAAHAVVVDTSSEMEEVVVSRPDIDVHGPLGEYAGLGDSLWPSPIPAVATYVHPSWPSIFGATWISTAYYTEEPIANNSWRWFHDEINIQGYPLAGNVVSATADNAEEVYFNGLLVGSDGEIQGPFIDNYEWSTILDYSIIPQPGLNTLGFIVRNYAGSTSPTANPTGLIYKVSVTYYPEETAWGAGTPFVEQGNWATFFDYIVQPVQLELTPTNYGPGLSETGTGEAVLYNPVGDPNFIVKVNIENAKEKNASYKVWIIADQPLLPLGHGGVSTPWYYLGELFTDNNGDGSFYSEITLGLSGLLSNIQIALNPGPLAGYKSEIGEIVIH